jgi:hypothetical protein
MSKLLFATAMGFMTLFSGCGQAPAPDEVVRSLEGKNFDDLKGYFLHYRSGGSTNESSIIFVSKYGHNCSPYAVDVIIKNQKTEFIRVNKELAIKSCGYDYIDESQIENLVNVFITFDVTLLGVDMAGNVYVNPSSQDLATLVKVKNMAEVNNASLYEHYNGDWYIRR